MRINVWYRGLGFLGKDQVEYEDVFRVSEICGIRVGWEDGFKFEG